MQKIKITVLWKGHVRHGKTKWLWIEEESKIENDNT